METSSETRGFGEDYVKLAKRGESAELDRVGEEVVFPIAAPQTPAK